MKLKAKANWAGNDRKNDEVAETEMSLQRVGSLALEKSLNSFK